jgi:cytochrome c-type biogenesis protein
MSVVSLVTDGPLLLATPVAAAAGLVSFFSPCVLPLVPGYLSYITGLSGADLEGEPNRRHPAPADVPVPAGVSAAVPAEAVLVTAGGLTAARPSMPAVALTVEAPVPARPEHERTGSALGRAVRYGVGRLRRIGRVTAGTGLFVLGFAVVFVSYGAAFGGLGQWLGVHRVGVARALGAVTILLGLMFAGAFSRFSWANREFRVHRLPASGLVGALPLGVLFGLGWTPCLGPTLGAVSSLEFQSATAGRGAVLSAVYCLGLGVPFLVVGLGFRHVAGALRVVRSHARLLTFAGGALLVAVGVLQVTGQWTDLVAHLRSYAPGFAETPL